MDNTKGVNILWLKWITMCKMFIDPLSGILMQLGWSMLIMRVNHEIKTQSRGIIRLHISLAMPHVTFQLEWNYNLNIFVYTFCVNLQLEWLDSFYTIRVWNGAHPAINYTCFHPTWNAKQISPSTVTNAIVFITIKVNQEFTRIWCWNATTKHTINTMLRIRWKNWLLYKLGS